MNMKMVHMVAFLLVIVGAVNWGLVGLLNLNLVELLFGASVITKIVYVVVGVCAVYIMATHKADCKVCGTK